MIKHKYVVRIGEKIIFQGEGKTYPTFREAQKKLDAELYQMCGHFRRSQNAPPVGTKGSATINISWACTMNGRAPARPKDVIAAEKARREAEHQARLAWEEKSEKARQQHVIHQRRRIQHQVDHAFRSGNSGTEPAAKYITCHCDAPAELLYLNQRLFPGAAVLDEETIIGAVCADHGKYTPGDVVEKIPCSRLEFFYDGVRQIAIKAAA